MRSTSLDPSENKITHIVERGIVLIVAGPTLSPKLLAEYIQRHNQIFQASFCLFDFTQVNFDDISSARVEEFLWRLAPRAKQRGNKKSAVVVDSELGFGMLRMYVQQRAQPGDFLHLFNTRKQARAWLLEP